MAYEYTAESHDLDLTLRAAWNLLMLGQSIQAATDFERKREQEFSLFAGSMMFSFCAIESFTSSVAFSMPNVDKYRGFDYDSYRKLNRFWEKVEQVCQSAGIDVDKSQGMFQQMKEMQIWRNGLSHASPYGIGETIIEDTVEAPHELHQPYMAKTYSLGVGAESSKAFYKTAHEYIELLRSTTGITPRASCSYRNLGENAGKN